MAEKFTDKYAAEWEIREPSAPGKNWGAHLTRAAYGTQAGSDVLAATSKDKLRAEADSYADDYIASGGSKPPARASLDVPSTPPAPPFKPLTPMDILKPPAKSSGGSALFLILIVALIVADGGKRGR